MKNRIFPIIIITCVLLINILLTGCWNRKELNELAIGVGMGIDKSDEQYTVSFQVVIPGEIASQGGGKKSPVTLYKATGKTLLEAIRRITTMAPRKMYVAHLRMVVLGDALAKDGIGEVLDFLSRDHELRTDFFIAVAKDSKAEDVLKILTPLENIPSSRLFSSLEASEKAWAPSSTVTLDQLINELVSDGKEPILTGVTFIGDLRSGEFKQNLEQIEPSTQLNFQGLGVFKEDKLIGWLNEEESKGLNYSLGNVKSTVVTLSCPKGGQAGVEIMNTEPDLKTTIKNGKPHGSIKIKAEGNMAEVACEGLDLTKLKTMSEIEKMTENDIKKKIEKSLNASQKEFEADLFGFGEALHRSNPQFWKNNKKEWNQLYSDIPVKVEVDVKIPRIGTISNSPIDKIKK